MEEGPPPPPTLKLQILQGPRQGETIEFRPGSPIRIGRVVRGNTLGIKDSGISTKHLSILFESGKWILRDLDSSNGTILDQTKIPPNTPFHLHDGSTIKIGEVTSILISFLHPQQNPTLTDQTGSVTMLKPVRSRRGKCLQDIDENESVNGADELGFMDPPAPKRVTRNSKTTRSGNAVTDSAVANLDAPVPRNTRATRNLKSKKKNVVEVCNSSVGDLDAAPEEKVEEEPKKNTRVMRNLKNKQSVIEISDSSNGISDAVEEEEEEEEEEETKKNTRVTRNLKNKKGSTSVIGGNSNLNDVVENVEKKKTRGGGRGRKKVQEERVVDDADADAGKETNGEREKANLNEDDDNCPDLEKMTLGEWFDFLEVHLPKQITDATEQMFGSMREKAERLREYIIMQENNKTQPPTI